MDQMDHYMPVFHCHRKCECRRGYLVFSCDVACLQEGLAGWPSLCTWFCVEVAGIMLLACFRPCWDKVAIRILSCFTIYIRIKPTHCQFVTVRLHCCFIFHFSYTFLLSHYMALTKKL
uniref:Uncharacterized protein n=1 Tax=Arundo donax TaxID=35708 RepID=A0A0A8Y590_ARUDO